MLSYRKWPCTNLNYKQKLCHEVDEVCNRFDKGSLLPDIWGAGIDLRVFTCAKERMVGKTIYFLLCIPSNTLGAHILPNKLFLNYTPLINRMWAFRVCLVDLVQQEAKFALQVTPVKIKSRTYATPTISLWKWRISRIAHAWWAFLVDHLPWGYYIAFLLVLFPLVSWGRKCLAYIDEGPSSALRTSTSCSVLELLGAGEQRRCVMMFSLILLRCKCTTVAHEPKTI